MPINRIVAIATAVLGLAGALIPILADMNWQDRTSVYAGLAAMVLAALKWLGGWQKHEENQTALELASLGGYPVGEAPAEQETVGGPGQTGDAGTVGEVRAGQEFPPLPPRGRRGV